SSMTTSHARMKPGEEFVDRVGEAWMILRSVARAGELNMRRAFFYQDARYRLVLCIPPSRDDKSGHSVDRRACRVESPRGLLRFESRSRLPLFAPARTVGGASEHER